MEAVGTDPTLKAGSPRGAPKIPGYRIRRELGRGSTGIVYEAEQLAVDRVVALKVLRPELARRGRAVRRLQREVRTTARLNHPNIVSALDMGETDGLWWYAMELVEGSSLAERIRERGTLSEREVLRLFLPLADALQHTFQLRVVHRDIKPGNTLIDSSGRPWLVDLGLAFADDDPMVTKSGTTLGTPHYVSPEQARNPQRADIRSDIWSLGASFYHALCGVPPFVGDSVAEILSGVLYSRIPDPRELNPRISKDMALVLRKCLTRDPARRYQEPAQLLDDLERIRERRRVRVQRSSLDPVLNQGSWRTRLLGGAAVLLIAALTILAVTRPWTGAGSAEESGRPALEPHAPLEAILQRARREDSYLGAAVLDLEEILQVLPKKYQERHQEVSYAVRALYRESVPAAARAARPRVDALLATGDLAGALALVSGFRAELGSRFGLAPAQLDQALRPADLDGLGRRVERELDEALKKLEGRVRKRYDDLVASQVDAERARGRWSAARELLVPDVGAWVAEQQISTAGLPEDRLKQILDHLQRLVCDRDREKLEDAWKALDDELALRVVDASLKVKAQLENAALDGPAEGALRQAFDEELAARELEPDQMLDGVQRKARAELEERAAVLRGLEALHRQRAAQEWMAESEHRVGELLADRLYARAGEVWSGGVGAEFLAGLRDRIELRRLEAQLLQDLLERAARAVTERDGERVELNIGGIVHSGTIDATADPLVGGFYLETRPARKRWLALREIESSEVERATVLGTQAVEGILGLAGDDHAYRDDSSRVAHALFRYHEGDREGARSILAQAGRLDGRNGELAGDLLARIQAADERDEDQRREDLTVARYQYRQIKLLTKESATPEKTRAVVEKIELLLTSYLYLDFVREKASELRDLRRELENPPGRDLERELREAFAPDELGVRAPLRVFFAFDFGRERAGDRGREVGTWRVPDDWRQDSYGWHAPRAVSAASLLEDGAWPELALLSPLDPDFPELEVISTIQQLRDSGEPRLLVLTVAGWHVALGSPGPLGQAGDGFWTATTGSRAALVELLESAADREGKPFPGLVLGHGYRIRMALTNERRRLHLQVEDLGLPEERKKPETIFRDTMSLPSPEKGALGTSALRFRSLEPVRLDRVEIEGRYR